MILLVTNKRDLTTDYIVRRLTEKKITFTRLNTEDLPKCKIELGINGVDDWKIIIDNKTLLGSEIKAAYFRRPEIPSVEAANLSASELEYVQNEWLAILKNLYWRLEGKWLNSPTDIFLAEDKAKQLVIAKSIGFLIPSTCITNNHETIDLLQSEMSIIAKPLKHALLSGSHEKVIFTTRIEPITNSDSDSIKLAPMIAQNEILKKYDVRVTVVANKVFATSIWSQEYQETTIDWRKGSNTNLKHRIIDLPNELQSKCTLLVSMLNLKFGAIDFICDANNNFWFLEINPNGQFAWIENKTNHPISEAIVNELVKICDNN